MAKKYYIGFLILVILTASIYIYMPDKVRIDIQKTRTKFSVWENEKWVLAATEYMNVFDGTAKMRAKSRNLSYETIGDITTIIRIANYKDNISTIQIYTFNSGIEDVEYIPVKEETICINCEGKIVQFEYRDILYKGITKNIESPFAFGHQMKLEWGDEAYRAKVYQQKSVDKIILRYRPESNYESYLVRMFDPVVDLGDAGTLIGDKVVKELCNPVLKTWTDEIKHYKNCTQEAVYNPINKTTTKGYIYTCLDYIEKIEHKDVQVDCIKTGKVSVSGKVIQKEGYWCRLQGNSVCCYPTEVGGQYAITWRTDGSVDRQCIDLITNKIDSINNLKKPMVSLI